MSEESADAVVRRWLSALGAVPAIPGGSDPCPHLGWAASGAMTMTGSADGAPVLAPGAVVPLIAAVGRALAVLTGEPRTALDPATVLGARAGLRALRRGGAVSAGGATRLLATRDGWAAVTLARADDLAAVPAMFGGGRAGAEWQELAGAAGIRTAAEFVERVRLFGVPAAVVPDQPAGTRLPWRSASIAPSLPGAAIEGALVVDLSSLWAGPLCAHLLGRAGARVVKVESTRRPDGARAGEPRFYDWLHAGHESLAIDFRHPEDRAELALLLASADVVIEASRPRALFQLGLAHDQVRLKPGVVWVSLTGHGRQNPDLVAFGDDAAAGGGLVAGTPGGPVFCGDAIADPLTGLVAALGAVALRSVGGGALLDVGMSNVAEAFAGAAVDCPGEHPVRARRKSWFVTCPATGREQRVLGPRVPDVTGRAPALGADNDRLLGLLSAS